MDNYGFVREKLDIKILILFILKRLPGPVSQTMLTELTLIDNATNYFDYIECLADLEKTGHVLLSGDRYSITPLGIRNGTEMEDHVPYTVKLRALAGIERASKILERESLIRTSSEERPEGGFTVRLSISDPMGELLHVDILAAGQEQARDMELRFRRDAESLYLRIAALLTEDPEGK